MLRAYSKQQLVACFQVYFFLCFFFFCRPPIQIYDLCRAVAVIAQQQLLFFFILFFLFKKKKYKNTKQERTASLCAVSSKLVATCDLLCVCRCCACRKETRYNKQKEEKEKKEKLFVDGVTRLISTSLNNRKQRINSAQLLLSLFLLLFLSFFLSFLVLFVCDD